MAWGFRKKKDDSKLVVLKQAMGRIINRSFSLIDQYPEFLEADEQRSETRAKRNCPIVVFEPEIDGKSANRVVGFTHDVSLTGLAVLSTSRMAIGKAILVIGDLDSRVLVAGNCISSSPREFGCFFSSFELFEILSKNDHEPMLKIVDQLGSIEQNLATSDLEIAQVITSST